MEITREYIESLKPGKEMDIMVYKHVLNKCEYKKENMIYPEYSTNIQTVQEVVEKYKEDFLLNFITPYRGFGYGWHCNINSVHSIGCSTQMEAICKASLIYALQLWNESEQHQMKKKNAIEKDEIELINELHEKIQKLERERSYTKQEIQEIFGYQK